MARPLSDPQRQEIATFLRALYQLGGYATQKEFADDAGYHQVNLSEAMNGKAGLDGLNLIHLIRAAAKRAGISETDAAVKAAVVPIASLSAAQEERRFRLLAEAEQAIGRLRREFGQ